MRLILNSSFCVTLVLASAWSIPVHAPGQNTQASIQPSISFADPSNVSIQGILGDAMNASMNGRLTKLPSWNNGELLNIFSSESKSTHNKTDWYGEHAGKWLYTMAIAVRQTHNPELQKLLVNRVEFLISTQEDDGYLGSYSPAVRITNAQANHQRSWDVWNLSYMTLGLLKVNEYLPNEKYLTAARKIGDLFIHVFIDGDHDITQYGTRHGVSSTIALDPAVELYKATKNDRYLKLAENIIKRMEANEGNKLVSRSLQGNDMETIGDGKAYQILWNLTALAKLYEATGNEDYLKATEKAWQNVNDYHLTINGGPWGGIGKHKECFNSKNYWSPYGYVETCSTMSWIQLNKELLRITGNPKYAQAIETSAYNALLGAQYPDGVDWCYHSFSNGSRHIAHFDDCCPSSGALALEELVSMAYSTKENGVALNLITASKATIKIENAGDVLVEQTTDYPFDGKVTISVTPHKPSTFPLFIRIPDWADGATASINGSAITEKVTAGQFLKLDRKWKKGDVVALNLPMNLVVHHQAERSDSPQGGRDLYDVDWISLTRGPLVYAANGLIGGKDREHAVELPSKEELTKFSELNSNKDIRQYELAGSSITFSPYYMAGGRELGTWRLTWIQNQIK